MWARLGNRFALVFVSPWGGTSMPWPASLPVQYSTLTRCACQMSTSLGGRYTAAPAKLSRVTALHREFKYSQLISDEHGSVGSRN